MRAMPLTAVSLLIMAAQAVAAVPLSGNLQGTLARTDEPYRVTANLTVPFGESLTIAAGTKLCFAPNTSLLVQGYLVAEGAPDKAITFSSCDANKHWGGIRFDSSKQVGQRLNYLSYVVVEYGDRTDVSGTTVEGERSRYGGGIAFEQSDAIVKRSIIRLNRAATGGGVYIGAQCAVSITDSAIHSNEVTNIVHADTGGAGIYVDAFGSEVVTIARNVIALNWLHINNYGNDEGGGGLYLHGGRARILFNLFVANRAGKAPGALILGDHANADSSTFYGNVFIANNGALNFEQVAVGTRFPFETFGFPDVWANNTGEFPFVAYLHRNSLAKYANYGQKISTMRLITGAALNDGERQFLRNMIRPAQLAQATLADASEYAPVCGSTVRFGPETACNDAPASLREYIRKVASASADPALGAQLEAALSVPASSTALQAETTLLDYESPDPPSSAGPIQLTDDFAAAAEGTLAPASLLTAMKAAKPPLDHRYLSPAMWLAVFGHDTAFGDFARLADLDTANTMLREATRVQFEDAAVHILETRSVEMFANSRKNLYDILILASSTGQDRLVKALLDHRLDPNIPSGSQYPLTVAASQGQLSTVILLLRSGAMASPPRFPSGRRESIPLFAALNWYHLQGGFKEIAELLIAAGADFGAVDPSEPVDPLNLQSWVMAGFPTNDVQWQSVLANSLKAHPAPSWPDVIENLTKNRVPPDATIASIRQYRSLATPDIVVHIGSSTAATELTALYRILESRRFALDDASRRMLYGRFDGAVTNSVRLDYILSLYQDGPVDSSLVAKGGSPAKSGEVTSKPALPFRRKFAVLVGVSRYAALPDRQSVGPNYQGLVNLTYAAKDATDVAETIRAGALGKDWEITELSAENASYTKVDSALKSVAAEAKEGDLVLFFFSGHGMPFPAGSDQVYLLLQDSNLQTLDSTALRLKALRDWSLGLKAKHAILLLDACHAGLVGVAKGSAVGLGYTELENGQQNVKAGKVALTSSIGGGLSYEDESHHNGIFTLYLLQAAQGQLVRPRWGSLLTVHDVYEALVKNIPSAATRVGPGISQIPGYAPLDGTDLLDFPLVTVN